MSKPPAPPPPRFVAQSSDILLTRRRYAQLTGTWTRNDEDSFVNDDDCMMIENFPSGCLFSPDGLCILTYTVGDSKLRLYNNNYTLPRKNNKGKCDEEDPGDSNNRRKDEESEKNQVNQQQQQQQQQQPKQKQDDDKTDDGGGQVQENEWKCALSCDAGEAVRSYAWYPYMTSSDPASCCFLSTARNQPVHLYDAYTGALRASYRAYNDLDEMESACAVAFTPDGQKILASGFRSDRTIHIFDTSIPGRESTLIRFGKTRRSSDGQKGLVSAMDTCAGDSSRNVVAVGTYAPGSIYLYDLRNATQPSGTILTGQCIVGHGRNHYRKKRRFVETNQQHQQRGNKGQVNARNGDDIDNDDDDGDDSQWLSKAKLQWFHARTQGGVTQLRFAPGQEHVLYSASRRSGAILSWDLRMLAGGRGDGRSSAGNASAPPPCGFRSYAASNDTNQRIQFDVRDSKLYTGGTDGCVRIYSTRSGDLVEKIHVGHGSKSTVPGDADDATVVNGVSFGCVPNANHGHSGFLAVACGSRHFPSDEDFDLDRIPLTSILKTSANCLRLYSVDSMKD